MTSLYRLWSPLYFKIFVQFGYIHTQYTGLMKLFTMPSDYKYSKKDDVIQALQATVLVTAKPPPAAEPIVQLKRKQPSITSYFRPNNNPRCRELASCEMQLLSYGSVYWCACCLRSRGSV